LSLDKNIIDRWQKSDFLLLGGSAGSFKLIFNIVKNFDADLGKAVIIIIHRKKNFFSEIEKLFADNSSISFREITDKEILQTDTVYIAPANYHTLIENDGSFALDVSEAIWYSRPSIDVTFESAAGVFKDKCTAILLSGANPDGAEGLLKLRNKGSLTIAQDPDEAEMPQMPLAAIELRAAEYILTSKEIFELLTK
jgi:two-component system, chemotaxis family, protein-glutamate methylesterase/glutaminase